MFKGLITDSHLRTWRDRWAESGGWSAIERKYIANKKGDKGEIYIYEQIGEDFWSGGGVTAKRFVEDLKSMGDVSAIDLHINSPGGVVTEADAIYTALNQHKAKIHVTIDGLAASAASFIAMAGDTIAIAEHAKIMIHNAWGLAIGNAHDLRKLAETLDTFDQSIRTIYQKRTGNSDKKLQDWMAAETWFGGKDAVDNGFADSLIEAKGKVKDEAHAIADLMKLRLDLAKQ